jgi:hypothetical protein
MEGELVDRDKDLWREKNVPQLLASFSETFSDSLNGLHAKARLAIYADQASYPLPQ